MAGRILNTKQSSQVKSAAYDPDTQTLVVEFMRGGTYSYSGVDADKAAALEASDIPGSFLHANIKNQHEYKKH